MKYAERIAGCWLGKSIGGTLGLPAEGKMERLGFTFYDPVPTVAPPNDDLELQLVWLDLIAKSSGSLTRADFANAWLKHIHYMWDEYGRLRWNLRRGVALENAGTFENPFHAGMGSPIRSEIWACLFPGDPESAAHYAALDASLDHGEEGIAGEVVFAAMQSEIAGGQGLSEAIAHALRYIPSQSETARAIKFTQTQFNEGVEAWACWEKLLTAHGNENFTHAPLNVALTIWALLYGKGDFEQSILLAVNGGYDTDCTAATAGATLGLALGQAAIPIRWFQPIGEGVFVGPGIQNIDSPSTLTELSARTEALIGKLKPERWTGSFWKQNDTPVQLRSLPGTIAITPIGTTAAVPWANGELPAEVKVAGGGTWVWLASAAQERSIVCLARAGAKLFVDDNLVMECPAHLPYVPAPHRCPEGSRQSISVAAGAHQIRLELNSFIPEQDACVILTYPNFHLAPWTAEELPELAVL